MAPANPPLPSITRPLFWLLRAFGILILVGALYAAFLAANQGRWDTAVLVLALGAGFAVMTWLHPLNPWFAMLLGATGLLTAWATQNLTGALLSVAFAGVLLWWPRRARRPGAVKVRVDRLEVVDPSTVMRGARGWVEEFERHGFTQAGAVAMPKGPFRAVESLLVSSDGLSYAAVTDAILHVTSLFPDGKALVTRNNDLAAQPPWVLVDNLPGGSPSDLIESHRKALELVAERDHYPVRLSAADLPALAIEGERSAAEWGQSGTPRVVSPPRGQLWNRLGRYDEIDTWHGAAAGEE